MAVALEVASIVKRELVESGHVVHMQIVFPRAIPTPAETDPACVPDPAQRNEPQ